MITLINISSLIIFISALVFAVVSKKINLPQWYEVIVWVFILGATGLLLNSLLEPPYIDEQTAEVALRFFGSIMVAGAVFDRYKRSINNELR